MLVRLTKSVRIRSAVVMAALYVFCVLSPVAAFGFSDASRAMHCFTENDHGLRSTQVHKHEGSNAHVHPDGTSHEHSKVPAGKSSDGQCCGLACLNALPASLSEVETPALPAMVAVSVDEESIAGNPPDRLYRPPIFPPSL